MLVLARCWPHSALAAAVAAAGRAQGAAVVSRWGRFGFGPGPQACAPPPQQLGLERRGSNGSAAGSAAGRRTAHCPKPARSAPAPRSALLELQWLVLIIKVQSDRGGDERD